MTLYKRLKKKDLVINEKELTELIYLRQIKIDDKRIIDPNFNLKSDKTYKVTVGILTETI